MDHNTKEGIAAQLGSYREFYALMCSRANLGYLGINNKKWEKLTPFVILGRYKSDELGQCYRLNRALFTDEDRMAMPPVMTNEEFRSFFEEHIQLRIRDSFWSPLEGTSGLAPGFPLPEPHLVCAKCGGTWEINTCHDIDAEGDFEEIYLSPFVGKTLFWVLAKFEARTDALRRFGHPIRVQNQQWTDPRAANDEYADPEELGWRDVTLDHIVQLGDNTSMFRYRFYHGPCFRQLNEERLITQESAMVEDMRQMLVEAGFENVGIIRISPPKHIVEWLAGGENLDDTTKEIADIADEIDYYSINTQQGSFGILVDGYPVLDLKESGVMAQELAPELITEDLSGESQFILPLTPAPQQFLRLWQLMVKHQSKK